MKNETNFSIEGSEGVNLEGVGNQTGGMSNGQKRGVIASLIAAGTLAFGVWQKWEDVKSFFSPKAVDMVPAEKD